jgi:hypothetical protein
VVLILWLAQPFDGLFAETLEFAGLSKDGERVKVGDQTVEFSGVEGGD